MSNIVKAIMLSLAVDAKGYARSTNNILKPYLC